MIHEILLHVMGQGSGRDVAKDDRVLDAPGRAHGVDLAFNLQRNPKFAFKLPMFFILKNMITNAFNYYLNYPQVTSVIIKSKLK